MYTYLKTTNIFLKEEAQVLNEQHSIKDGAMLK